MKLLVTIKNKKAKQNILKCDPESIHKNASDIAKKNRRDSAGDNHTFTRGSSTVKGQSWVFTV